MSNGSAPFSAYCIELDSIKELCRDEVVAIEKLKKELGISWESIAKLFDEGSGYFDDAAAFGLSVREKEKLQDLWDQVVCKFAVVTKIDNSTLELMIGYYDDSVGDIYDTLEKPVYFFLENAVEYTPAAKKIQDKISYQMWTQYF